MPHQYARSLLISLSLFCATLMASPLVHAHHPSYPAALQFVPHEQEWTLITTSGFVDSRFPEELICKEAFDVTGRVYATVLGPGHYAVASESGLAITRDGCSIAVDHALSGRILDLHSQGDVILGLEVGLGPDILQMSTDGGDTLTPIATLPDRFQGTTVKVLSEQEGLVAGFDKRIATRGEAILLRINLDTGALTELVLGETIRFPFLFAVNSTTTSADNAQSPIAWVARNPVDPTLFWGPLNDPTRYNAPLDYWPIWADFDTDQNVWLGGLDLDLLGLARGNAQGFTLDERFVNQTVTCITADGDGLWICSDGFADDFEVWRVDGQADPEPFYRLAYLQGPRQCPAHTAVGRKCGESWALVAPEIPGGGPSTPPDSPDPDPPTGGDTDSEPDLPDWVTDPIDDDSEDIIEEPAPPQRTRGCDDSGSFALLILLFPLTLGRLRSRSLTPS